MAGRSSNCCVTDIQHSLVDTVRHVAVQGTPSRIQEEEAERARLCHQDDGSEVSLVLVRVTATSSDG